MFITLAYLDPGTGSLAIQVVIAAVVAIPIVFKAQLRRLASLVRRHGRRDARE